VHEIGAGGPDPEWKFYRIMVHLLPQLFIKPVKQLLGRFIPAEPKVIGYLLLSAYIYVLVIRAFFF
jgi:hypothetical protein